MRIRRNAAGFAVTWRYNGHRYRAIVPSAAKARTMLKASRDGKEPAEVMRIAWFGLPAGPSAPDGAIGKAGGIARAKALEPYQRSAIASKAALARWAKRQVAK